MASAHKARMPMSSPPLLTVVSPPVTPVMDTESLAGRIRRLQAEARTLAKEQIGALEAKLQEAAVIAAEIAGGGDAYPVGARELARKVAEDAPRTIQSLEAIVKRA